MFAYMRRGPNFYKGGRCSGRAYHPPGHDHQYPEHGGHLYGGAAGEEPMAAVTLANIPLFVVQLFIFGVQSAPRSC